MPLRPPWILGTTSGPVGKAPAWDRWDRRAIAAAAAIGVWVFAAKLTAFLRLSFSSDLFMQTQLARSWLEGRFLEDNCFGKHLPIHTYLLLPVFGLIAKPLGAPGLLLVLAAAIGASVFLAHRILRLLDVSGPVALATAVALAISPVSIWAFGESRGFHVELLKPALGLALLYLLLQQKRAASLLLTLMICAVTEDSPILAAVIAVIVVAETRFAHRIGDRIWHRPALASLVLAAALFPLLLFIKASQAHSPHTIDHLSLVSAHAGAVRDGGGLFLYAVTHAPSWVVFALQQGWPALFVAATFGLVLLRPLYAPLALATTVVAWLLNEDMLWGPRAASALAFWWCAILIGVASLARALRDADRRVRWRLAGLGAVVVSACLLLQLHFVVNRSWDPIDLHVIRPSPYSAAERKQADQLFANYRRLGRPDEPVAASPYLFRYAHDRNLFWLDRLQGRPKPTWLLQDGEWNFTAFGLRTEDYVVVGRAGRFVLLKRNPESVSERVPAPAPP